MLWVGTYEAKGGQGLYPVACSPAGRIEVGEPERRIANASFAAWCPRTRTAYFVNELDEGRVSAWGHVNGTWHPRGTQPTGGQLPCYVSLAPSGRYLAVANYGDGSVALFARDFATGSLGDQLAVRRAFGHGPNPERQDGPHAHCALFSEDGATLFHVDLGADHVFAYPIAESSLGEPQVAFTAPPASGPRHLLLLPGRARALLSCELSAELLLLERDGPRFQTLHTVKTAPSPEPADNLGGHLGLAPNGDVLVTNRGHDSLARFALTGDRLEPRECTATGGSSPRHFHIGPVGTLIAHEESGTLALIGPAGTTTAELPGAAFILSVD